MENNEGPTIEPWCMPFNTEKQEEDHRKLDAMSSNWQVVCEPFYSMST